MATASEQLIVVGGGAAGCAAAIEAAKLGLRVTLIDEHPQSLSAMSLDAPYFYGARLIPALSDESLIADRVLGSNDLLMECLEAGVEVLTGTCVWGSYRPGANNLHLEANQLGVADAKRSWMISYDHLILAPGSRDLVLSFPGWHLPGVLGVNGAIALLERYQALGGNRIAILGSGNVALRAAKLIADAGMTVTAIVETAANIRGDADLAANLAAAGVPFFLSHTVERVIGDTEVKGIRLVKVDSSLTPLPGTTCDLDCDTVCMAFGAIPNIELASVTGCGIIFDSSRGGWVPDLDSRMQTSLASVYVVGDGAGVSEAMFLDPGIAGEQGRHAARAIAEGEGLLKDADAGTIAARSAAEKSEFPPQAWLQSLIAAGGLDVVVCQCEEVTRRELLDVSPPRYLHAGNQRPAGGLQSLSPSGRRSQDLLKRLTRAGMGHCQGKRCRDQTAMLLAHAAGGDLESIVAGSYRTPVRPLPLNIMWASDETEEMRRTWPTWLHPTEDGIPERMDENDHGKR